METNRQNSPALPGLFPGSGSGWVPPERSRGRSCCAALPRSGLAAAQRADRGGFGVRRFCAVTQAQGHGQAAGHTITPTLPSSLPLGDVQLAAQQPRQPSEASPAASPPFRLRFQFSPRPPSPQSHQLPPPALGSIHPAGTGPRDGAACLPASVSKQMEDISSLVHPSTIVCLAHFLSGTPLLTASESPVPACLFPYPSLITCLSWASIFPKAFSPYLCRMP